MKVFINYSLTTIFHGHFWYFSEIYQCGNFTERWLGLCILQISRLCKTDFKEGNSRSKTMYRDDYSEKIISSIHNSSFYHLSFSLTQNCCLRCLFFRKLSQEIFLINVTIMSYLTAQELCKCYSACFALFVYFLCKATASNTGLLWTMQHFRIAFM